MVKEAASQGSSLSGVSWIAASLRICDWLSLSWSDWIVMRAERFFASVLRSVQS
jgi:hypothetical protein